MAISHFRCRNTSDLETSCRHLIFDIVPMANWWCGADTSDGLTSAKYRWRAHIYTSSTFHHTSCVVVCRHMPTMVRLTKVLWVSSGVAYSANKTAQTISRMMFLMAAQLTPRYQMFILQLTSFSFKLFFKHDFQTVISCLHCCCPAPPSGAVAGA